MAARYLRASGNWNGPVWAATSSGAAGSAATPTALDEVQITANFTVTLNQNAEVATIYQASGTLRLSSYQLKTWSYQASGPGTRTLDLGSGTMICGTDTAPINAFLFLIDPNSGTTTVVPGSSLLVLNTSLPQFSTSQSFGTASKTFNDVRINIGHSGSAGTTLDITGSPTFRSLVIQSKNSAAHTVNFEEGFSAEKLIALGSSQSNKLSLIGGGAANAVNISNAGSVYGSNLYIERLHLYSDTPGYIGASSTLDFADNWLLQDPPKISTLVDPLTLAPSSNANWSFPSDRVPTKTTVGLAGGGYNIPYLSNLLSIDTYDLYDSEFLVEINGYKGTSNEVGFGFGPGGIAVNQSNVNYGVSIAVIITYPYTSARFRVKVGASFISDIDISSAVPTLLTSRALFKIKVQTDRTVKLSVSTDSGNSWANFLSASIPLDYLEFVRSIRLDFNNRNYPEPLVVGSVNPSLSFEGTKTQTTRARISRTYTKTTTSTANISTWSSSVYYFDAHNAITDPNDVWTNRQSAFDNDDTTSSLTVYGGEDNYLLGGGTSAPSVGGTITSVSVRVKRPETSYFPESSYLGRWRVFSESFELLYEFTGNFDGSTTGGRWGIWREISVPTGGWTWNKVQNLQISEWLNGTGTISQAKGFFDAQLVVNHEAFYEVSKSQDAIAAISAPLSKTQIATATISHSFVSAQTATAFVTSQKVLPITAVARIVNTRTSTQSATSRVSSGYTKTQTAVSRISVQHTKLQSAIARISNSLGTDYYGPGFNFDAQQEALARISSTFSRTQTSIGRIAQNPQKTQAARAKIAVVSSREQLSVARIEQSLALTQTAKAQISRNYTKTQTAKAFLVISRTSEQTATAALIVNVTATQSATAYIGTPYVKPPESGGDEKYDQGTIPTGTITAVTTGESDDNYEIGATQSGDYDVATIDESNIYGVE